MLIIYEGPFFTNTSFAIVNRYLCSELVKYFDLKILPSDYNKQFLERLNLNLQDKIINFEILNELKEPDIYIRQKWPPDFHIKPKSKILIQYFPWEYGAVPKIWLNEIHKNITKLWVPSTFVKKCLIKNDIDKTKIDVIPNGIDLSIFNSIVSSDADIHSFKKSTFNFLFVGGSIPRKGIDLLLMAYSTFCNQKDVSLTIKDYPVNTLYSNEQFIKKIETIKNLKGMPKINYISKDLNDIEIKNLYKSSDVLVSPYRGEGFGMPLLESLCVGTPVIATNYGASLDFCKNGPCYMLKHKEVIQDSKQVYNMETLIPPFAAEPDLNDLCKAMLTLKNNYSSFKQRTINYSKELQNKYSWESIGIHTKKIISNY